MVKRSLNPSSRWAFWRWQHILQNREPYLTRLVVFRCPLFQLLVHWIHKADSDPALHDHPWWFAGFVVQGEYLEKRAKVGKEFPLTFIHSPRNQVVRFLVFNPLRRAHRIIAVHGRVVTILLTGPKVKSWGFYQHDQEQEGIAVYTPWKEFLS